jgi:hypothetical protein
MALKQRPPCAPTILKIPGVDEIHPKENLKRLPLTRIAGFRYRRTPPTDLTFRAHGVHALPSICQRFCPALFRWFRDGRSAPVRRTWFLGCHHVRVRVVLRGQFSSQEPQNSVECFAEEIHEDAASCATCYHLAKPRQTRRSPPSTRRRSNPNHLPMVSVEVVETRSIHEPQVNRIHGTLTACIECSRCQFVHFCAASTRACDHTFRMRLPVAYLSSRERLKEWLAEKHYMCMVVHDHAGRPVIGQSPIELEPKLPEELHRALHIADRQVNEETSRLHRAPGCHFRVLVAKSEPHRCLTGSS